MKKTVAILFLLILAICSSFGQEINPELQKEKFNTRAHQQQKTGWILLGIGTAVTTIGVVAYYAEKNSEPDLIDFTGVYTAITVGGSVITLSSIPYFISSGKNKRKAQRIELGINFQPYVNSELTGITLKPQPALKITLNF